MGRHRQTDASQGNTMEQYTTPVALSKLSVGLEVIGDAAGAPLSAGERSRAELLAAIQGSWVVLEGKIETVVVEVNLLRAELQKLSDKVKVADGPIAELRSKVGTLWTQMAQATSTVGRLEAKLEDEEGRSRRKNVRLLGFPERAAGSAGVPLVLGGYGDSSAWVLGAPVGPQAWGCKRGQSGFRPGPRGTFTHRQSRRGLRGPNGHPSQALGSVAGRRTEPRTGAPTP
ncbi:hypothetical protein NDU88_004385 [Pleurodeles waltl]|uniref:Uncharacterized protein n=1 Tax=Pleurodeles waltl TaxID=8319 RepID=A0AAV7LQT3_PLEWA|nr:hypothetical protein NDU88_004385 [Pleurodeles waltl]